MSIRIAVRNILAQASGLTQARSIGYTEGNLPVGSIASPRIFTRTLMASVSGDYLFEVGAGRMDAIKHTRVLIQHAADTGTPFSEVAESYLDLLSSLGYSQEPFRRVVAHVMGASEKPARANAIAAVTPSAIFAIMTKVVPEGTHDLYTHMMTDYVCHMLRPLGWIVDDAPFVYRIRRVGSFPTYSDLVDVMIAQDLQRTLQYLADADLSLVKAAIEKKGALMPAMTAQHMANAVVMAHEVSKGAYDAEAVVRSVLTAMIRVSDPTLPKELEPKTRVRNHPVMAELQSNLALTLAYQDMVRAGYNPEISYSEEEMAAVVLPSFSRALAEISPYSLRILEDVVSHIGKRSTRSHMGHPGHVMVFEDWEFGDRIEAFTRVKQSANGKQCFLRPQTNVASALTAAMRPVRSVLNITKLVERRLTTYEMAASSQRVPQGGTEIILAFPSLLEAELSEGVTIGAVSNAVINGEVEAPEGMSAGAYSKVKYDYMSLLTHLAVAKNGGVSMSIAKCGERQNPYLIWNIRTSLKEPIGQSAIVMGEVMTTEPLEAIAYMDDFSAATPREARVLPISDYESAVHIWDWFNASMPLALQPSYSVSVRNKDYLVALNEHEMLGLGVQRKNVRFIRPIVATAIARLWMEWIFEDQKYIEDQVEATKDTYVQEGFRGRALQNAMELVNLLTAIGTAGAGANSSTCVMSRLADQMYAQGNIDDYSELHVGVQAHRLRIWSGLVTLNMLGMINVEDAAKVITYLADNEALSLVVGITSY